MRYTIALPKGQHNQGGGSATFRRHFEHWLEARGISWTDNLDADYDFLFVNAWQTPYREVYRHKKRFQQLRVIHRIDGAGKDYGRTDGSDAIQEAVNTLADLTIFQSDYSRYSTSEKYRIIRQNGPVIYNPVDTEAFTPNGEHLDFGFGNTAPVVLSAIWSPNPRKGAWRVPFLAEQNPTINFVYIGSTEFETAPPNLKIWRSMLPAELAKAMRSADVFVNLSQNDPCPNVVLEAMASGLPVLFVKSGGTPELVAEGAGLSFETDDEFQQQLHQVLADLDAFSAKARQHVEDSLRLDIVFPQYWNAIEKSHRKPLPSPLRHFISNGQRWRVWLNDKLVNFDQYLSRSKS